ncbi:efflux transporter outer membrane subunit [Helicobacter sp. 11S02596-1]|uniref:efflux transporter outer membrane subunit n=1 Tax=Helicobacter sp. 11S02596-1 TaxID=1476194 RepID=UPI000BA67989|nr:efflux transporter outer membrane subunit [Helicobacter sp. 11S02596-1]PAF44805.1 hypothetical protein BJI48_02120 [Helicobacter sp. 11S02596-1]
MPTRRIIMAFAIGILLSSCAPKIPEIPKDAGVVMDLPLNANEKINKDWWQNFNDNDLMFLIEKARDYNSDVQISKTHIQEALAALKVARSTLFPSVSLSANPQYTQNTLTPLFGFKAPVGALDPALNISYDFDFFGKNANERKSKLYQTQAIIAQTYATQLNIDSIVASTYINLLALKDHLKLLQDTLKTRKIQLEISTDKASVGYTSGYDNQQAKIQYEATKSQIAPVQLAIIKTQNALEELTGVRSKDLKTAQSLALINQPSLPKDIPSSILRHRPDIAYAEFALAASSATLAKARANFLPSFNLIANIGAFMVTSFTGVSAIIPVGALGTSILAPIFEGGRLKGEFAIANAKRDEAAYTYKKIVLNALKEIRDAQASIEWTKKQQTSLDNEYQAARKTLEYAKDRYESGYSSYLEVVDAERSLLELEVEIIDLKATYIQSLINLYHALGSGFDTARVKIPNSKKK